MAIGATIYKLNLILSNLNTHQYEDYQLTMPMHPSENEERLMWRLICFCLSANQDLQFTKGLSTQDEPELWQKDLTGEIIHWIEMGLPDEKRIRQALGKAQKVTVFTTHPNKSNEWHEKVAQKIQSEKFQAYHLSAKEDLRNLCQRTMNLTCTIQDEIVTLADENNAIDITVK